MLFYILTKPERKETAEDLITQKLLQQTSSSLAIATSLEVQWAW